MKAFEVMPLYADSVPVAFVGVHKPDRFAVHLRPAAVSLPNPCCFQMSRSTSVEPSETL